ncbi:MAG: hypothetical protein COB50_04535 [Thiotrichales bacterium]|nr:MAG: hypothetical protein COB50_04535 [Thiotrichales bacterium]
MLENFLVHNNITTGPDGKPCWKQLDKPLKPSMAFKGYHKLPIGADSGKQAKASGTGFYWKDGKIYFIKKSLSKPEEDFIEVILPGLGNLLAKDRFAPCHSVVNNNGAVYIASLVAEGSQILRKKTGFTSELDAKGQQQAYKNLLILLPEYGKIHKEIDNNTHNAKKLRKIFGKIQELRNKTDLQMAKIIVGCLLTREFDLHPGNIMVTNDGIKKFDHGWAFDGIMQHTNPEDVLQDFKKSRKLQIFRSKPTNHFADYPQITGNVAVFAAALADTINNFNAGKTQQSIIKSFQAIEKQYTNKDDFEAHMQKVSDRLYGSNGKPKYKNINQLAAALTSALSSRNQGLKMLYKQTTGNTFVPSSKLKEQSLDVINNELKSNHDKLDNLHFNIKNLKIPATARHQRMLNKTNLQAYKTIKQSAGTEEWNDIKKCLPKGATIKMKLEKYAERLQWRIANSKNNIEILMPKRFDEKIAQLKEEAIKERTVMKAEEVVAVKKHSIIKGKKLAKLAAFWETAFEGKKIINSPSYKPKNQPRLPNNKKK